ncbi:Prolyl 4-hydroxylase 5 [Symbiodinium microadriaticum]|uniref:Prolyl 4-hydroxylase 5 n=1 Tax=Symbiodinium microadriaticum TaxID=2951 RepID=A0A1Q9CZB9_SYMMI|nr:Prolyl 4-hydroxylase 5 [Symbiodinium microadriaticum]
MVVDPIEIEPESRETTVGNSVDCRRVLTAMNIFGDPEVLLVRDFLDAAEIQHLIDFAESGWEPSEVGQGVYRTKDEGQDLANQVSEIRTSYSCLIEPGQSEIITAIENRLAALAGMDIKFLEPLNMVRYLPGQYFNQHHDGRFRPKTIFVYLNDIAPGDGGETMFPELRLKIVPRRGCAVMWSNVLGPQQEDKRMDPKMALLLTILAAVAVVGSAFDRNLIGDEAKGNSSNTSSEAALSLTGRNVSWTQPVVEVANFTEYVRTSFDFFQSTWKSMFGNSSDSNRNDTGDGIKRRSCLCIFDVDRAITAHPHRRPNLPVSESVVGCNGGCKARHAARLASELGVAKAEVYMFDDKASNINPFRGTGMNAHQVHQGLPPTTGTKYGINCFFNDKPMRRFVCEGSDPVPANPRINGEESSGPETFLDPLLLQQPVERPAENPQLKPGGRCFRRLRVSKEPALWVVPDLVSGREARLLMDVVDKQQGRIPPNSPREQGSDGEVEELLADLQERLRAAAGSASQLELLELRRLAPSKQASAGAPVITAPSTTAHAENFRAVYLFLNDIPDGGGGELHFPKIRVKVRARRGFAVVWNCGRNAGQEIGQDHLGLPPQTCARYGAACSFSTESG